MIGGNVLKSTVWSHRHLKLDDRHARGRIRMVAVALDERTRGAHDSLRFELRMTGLKVALSPRAVARSRIFHGLNVFGSVSFSFRLE